MILCLAARHTLEEVVADPNSHAWLLQNNRPHHHLPFANDKTLRFQSIATRSYLVPAEIYLIFGQKCHLHEWGIDGVPKKNLYKHEALVFNSLPILPAVEVV